MQSTGKLWIMLSTRKRTALQAAGDRSRNAHLGAGGWLGHIGVLSQAPHEGGGVVVPGYAPAGMPWLPPSFAGRLLQQGAK